MVGAMIDLDFGTIGSILERGWGAIRKAAYDYQEGVDQAFSYIVPETSQNIEISDRAAGLIAMVFSLAGCTPQQSPTHTVSDTVDATSETQPANDGNKVESICVLSQEVPYDGIDQDCDGFDLADVDGDGYCKAGYEVTNRDLQCAKDLSYIGTDCDDVDKTIFPGAVEKTADDIDQNCNGPYDEDQDGDHYTLKGTEYNGKVYKDCNDNDPNINPGAFEDLCNNLDDDCDGLIDGAKKQEFNLLSDLWVPGDTSVFDGMFWEKTWCGDQPGWVFFRPSPYFSGTDA